MRYEFFIGLRYLHGRRRETFISLITVISILGVMIGVMTLNVVMAVMTGFEEVLRDRLLGINAHVALMKPGDYVTGYEKLIERIAQIQGVVAASPAVYGQVMVSSKNRVSGVVVRGVDPSLVAKVIDIQRYIREGSLQALKLSRSVQVDGREVSLPGVILGTRLADQLRVTVGDPVQLISPLGTPTAFGVIPKVSRFVVVGLFDSGMHEYDNTLVFLNLSDAQRFFGLGDAVTSIEIRVQDVYRAQDVAQKIQQSLGLPYWTEDWSRLWPNLFSALRLEKTVYFLVLLLMILVGAFNIISTLIMVVMEKRRDIAILLSMGATRGSIRKIFLIKGCVIGIVGTLLGVLLGYGICLLIQEYKFIELPKDVFLISTVPVRIYLSNFILVALASFFICLLASLYPARHAAKLDPVEIIRYE
ncbi:MAG TPA: lipoprotein-releasing ABC transporter permease subunit [Candidatus Binatia bacterium]|jgi:lipoprotein-releasing system permease protein|nr:lipoprotein-releasing ABC transporter permease subunit [Candidatus Binatia bacterium]